MIIMTILSPECRLCLCAECPYCAQGVWDPFPDWDDCSKVNYCLNGNILELDCRLMGSRYFNPTTKECEDTISANNNCFNRNFNLLAV